MSQKHLLVFQITMIAALAAASGWLAAAQDESNVETVRRDEVPHPAADMRNLGVVEALQLGAPPRGRNLFGMGGSTNGRLVSYDGLAYVSAGHDSIVFAIEVDGGEQVWTADVGGDYVTGIACSCDRTSEYVVVTTYGGAAALDRKTGAMIWRQDNEQGLGAPVLVAGIVYAAGNNGTAYALDLKTGAVLWTRDFLADAPKDPPGFDGSSARVLDHKARPGTPSCDGETVIFPVFDQCRLVALDARSGERCWDFQTQGWTYGRPAITDRHVFVGSQDEHFYGVDKETGKQAWKFKTGSRIEASCAASGGFVYIGSCDGNLYCLRQEDGALQWKFATDERKDFGSPIYAQPVLCGNTVFLASMEGQVYAVSADSGKLKWKLRPSEHSEIDGSFTDGLRWFVSMRRTNDAAGENALYVLEQERRGREE